MITVIDTTSGRHQYYRLDDPKLAVICAYAQAGDDWRDKDYLRKYGYLVVSGKLTVSCGDHCALVESVMDQMEEVRAADF